MFTQTGTGSALEALSVTEPTRARYSDVLLRFDQHLARLGVKRGSTPRELDRQMSSYFESLFFGGHKPYMGDFLLSAVLFSQPEMKGALPHAYKALKGWRRQCPSETKMPWGLDVWSGVMNTLVLMKRSDAALFVALALSCYLRPCEGLSVCRRDLVRKPGYGRLEMTL
eukprot:5790246-Amphidinium_carterae.1